MRAEPSGHPERNVFRRDLIRWFGKHGRDLPWRRTRDPYAVLVSEVMLQQTQVTTVVPYFEKWMKHFPTFAALSAASIDDVLHAWQGLGYYSRARNLHACAGLVAKHKRFPRDVAQIEQLPGIGKYIAHAVATFAFDQSVPVIEANTARVIARLFDICLPIDSARGRDALWSAAGSLVPKRGAREFNSALMDLGATICIARTPRCSICPVKGQCRAKDPASLPIKRERKTTVSLVEAHAFIRRGDSIILQQSQKRWRGMWTLPSTSCRPNTRPLSVSTFPFTHHRVTLQIYSGHRARLKMNERWVRVSDLHSMAMPSPHRRAAEQLVEAFSTLSS